MKKAPSKNLNVRYEHVVADPAGKEGDRRELERIFDMIFGWVLEDDAAKAKNVAAQNKAFPTENNPFDNSAQLGISLNHEDSYERGNRKTAESTSPDGREVVGKEDSAGLQTRQGKNGAVARPGGRVR